ncbi:MAG: Transposase IS4 family protein [Desulfotomaculum sp. 46_80]|nr:MAG: Transposase IS4 family protein [Desulfotomaculum sp. 46_80]
MNQKQLECNAPATLSIDMNERIKPDFPRKNFGYAALSKIYHELGIHTFLINRQRNLDIDYSLNNIVKLLVFSRLLNPASKMKTYEEKGSYFENNDFSLDDVYRSLSLINKYKDALQLWIHQRICESYGRNTELVYYDVTNYYFEIDKPDELRKKGVSKEHRPDPIVQMGLFMDTMGLPISYRLFPGNEPDKTTLIPILTELTREYNLGRIIVVAGKGLNTARNVYFNSHGLGNGYVLSQTVRGAQKELKDFVFNEKGYVWRGEGYKIKSRLYPREITITASNGKPKKVQIDEKQVVFYSRDYDKRAKTEREPAIMKALDLVRDPAKYNKATSYGAAKYVKNLVFDKKTGEILTSKQKPVFDAAKLKEEEKFDGYYAIVTSKWKKSDDEIIEIYRGLWRIEESFKVTKSEFV